MSQKDEYKKLDLLDESQNDKISYKLNEKYFIEDKKLLKYKIQTVLPQLNLEDKLFAANFDNFIKQEVDKQLNAFRMRMNLKPNLIKQLQYPAWLAINFNTIVKTNYFIVLQFNIRRDYGDRPNIW